MSFDEFARQQYYRMCYILAKQEALFCHEKFHLAGHPKGTSQFPPPPQTR